MQVLVLGMHRSGTSVLTHLLSRLGCYAGRPESLKPGDAANARGYWERWDAWALDEQILAAAGASWWKVADLDLESLAEGERPRFEAQAREIVAGLDEHRPWVLKDPRLSVLLPLWRPVLSAPVFVLAHRDPLETARSLLARDGFPLAVGIALWEIYNLAALRDSLGAPRLCVSYGRLLSDPAGVAAALVAGLAPFAPGALAIPAADELAEVVASALHHQRAQPGEHGEYLNASQRALHRALDDETALDWDVVPACSAGALDTLRSFAAAESERLTASRLAQELAGRSAEAEGEAAWRRDREREHERWIASLRDALAKAEAELGRLRQRDTDISQWNETLTARLAAAESEAAERDATRREEAATAAAELDRLRQRDADISQWNETLLARLAAAESEAAERDAAQRKETAGLTAQLGELRRMIGRLRDESRALQGEAEELQGRLAAVQSVLAETARHAERSGLLNGELERLVAEILRSRSWRLGRSLTAPARWGQHAVLAESRHERLRRAAEGLAAAQRSLAAQAAPWVAEDGPPAAKPEGGR